MLEAPLPGWTTVTLDGHPIHLFIVPDSPYVTIDLHPYGGSLASGNPLHTKELQRLGLSCIAPFGGRSWWGNRICPEFDPNQTPEEFLLRGLIPWLEERFPQFGSRFALTGISMGGQGALRLGFRHPKRFPVVAGIASALEYDQWYGFGTPLDEMYPSAEHCRQDTAILQIDPHHHPTAIWFACDPNDATWYRGNDRLHEKLRALGIPHLADLDSERGGHSYEYFNTQIPPMLAYVRQALEKEHRRLI